MGKYFNPVTDLPTKGRPLRTYSETWAEIHTKVNKGEVLVGLFDRGLYKAAPLLETEKEFTYWMEQYKQGMWIDVEFWAVPCDVPHHT